MMIRIPKLTSSSLLLPFFGLVLGLTTLISISSSTAYAEPISNGTIDKIISYCKDDLLPKRLQESCSNKNAESARNVASYHCKYGPNDDPEACILRKAKGYFKDAADPMPSTAGKFNFRLSQILKDVGGDPNAPNPDAGVKSTASCEAGTCSDPAADPNADCGQDKCDFIRKYVNPSINLLTMVFGIIAVISLIIGGIQFSASSGDPQRVGLAKKRITNTVLAIVAYFILYGFLQFLIPGGLFK